MRRFKLSIFLLGVFSIAIIVILVFLALFIDRDKFTRSYTLYAHVDDATGLVENTVVTINGVNVGIIKAIELTEEKILITFNINRGIRIRASDELRIIPVGLLGSSGIQIHTVYEKNARILEDGEFIEQVRTRTDFSSVIDSFNTVLSSGEGVGQNIEDLSKAIQDVVESQKLLERISEIIINIETITRELSIFSANIAGMQTESFTNVEDIIASVRETSFILRDIIAMQKRPDSDLNQSIARLNTSLEHIESIAGRVARADGSVFKLLEDDELYNNLNEAVANINEITKDATGIYTEVNYDFKTIINEANASTPLRFKNKFNLNIKPEASSRYYVLGVSTGEPGTQQGYPSLGDTGLKLNAQIAQRLGSQVVLKGGIFENSGGLGLEYSPFNWWKLSTEAYDFGNGSGAYLNASTEFYPFFNPIDQSNPLKWLSISLGADDILDSYSRGYFISVGLTFRDKFIRDVASLVPLAGAVSSLD